MMKVLWLAVCKLLLINISQSTFTKDSACGVTKGCYSDCATGCTYLISWSSGPSVVTFTIKVELSTNANQYGAFGLSSTQSMDAASVTACLMTSSGATFTPRNYYNTGYANSAVSNATNGLTSSSGSYMGTVMTCTFDRSITNTDGQVFNLQNDYYMLFAAGEVSGLTNLNYHNTRRTVSSVLVDLQSVVDVGAAKDELPRIKAHGGIAIIAWMCMVNLGYVVARYYKALWSSKILFGAAVWFLIHRVLMITGAVLTITSFGVIIQGNFDVGENNFEKSHPYIGVLVFCLAIINPIIGILRPDKQSKYRPIFYWFHFSIGVGAFILALINIFIGIRLRKAATSDKAYYIFIAYEVFQVTLIIVLEVLNFIEKINVKKKKNAVEMKQISEDQQETNKKNSEDKRPYAWTAKLVILCINVVVTVCLSTAITAVVAATTASSD